MRGPHPVEVPPLAKYFNRELSALDFNERVLAQAEDPAHPLLERLRFLTIATANLDEFFEIRVAGLKQHVRYGTQPPGIDGLSAPEVLAQVSQRVHGLMAKKYRVLNEDLLPALTTEGIRLLKRQAWTPAQSRWIEEYFRRQVKPVLTPIGLDPAHPFPMVLNKGLCFIVTVEGRDAFERESGVAVIQVPRSLPRVIQVPDLERRGGADLVLLSSVLRAHVDRLFPGMHLRTAHQFRVTRNSDLWVDEEEVENLMQALQGELTRRAFGQAVRLEVSHDLPDSLCRRLLREEDLSEDDVYRVDGPVNLHRLAMIYEVVDRPDLKFKPFVPGLPSPLKSATDLFAVISQRDVLLHHPYQAFAPVVDLLRQAARDPHVLAVKQTLYRTDADSPIVQALVDASLAGKDVTALVELRARFDEATNIGLAQRLEEVGVNVVYGIVGYKTHAKLLLIIRREKGKIRRYAHLGTGNYHTRTTRAYSDLALLTARSSLGRDVQALFDQLTGLGQRARLRRLVQSPFTLHERVIELIDAEAGRARAGGVARIRARMNSLSERNVIDALYAASRAGVEIDLLVRGICCLRPGLPGLSDSIRVRSIVGRFLEHARAWHFHAGGEEIVYLTSADWMSRNLKRRVEAAVPIRSRRLKKRILEEAIDLPLRDDTNAWCLQGDGVWRRVRPAPGQRPQSAQQVLLERLARQS